MLEKLKIIGVFMLVLSMAACQSQELEAERLFSLEQPKWESSKVGKGYPPRWIVKKINVCKKI